jgi:hypothetical protein
VKYPASAHTTGINCSVSTASPTHGQHRLGIWTTLHRDAGSEEHTSTNGLARQAAGGRRQATMKTSSSAKSRLSARRSVWISALPVVASLARTSSAISSSRCPDTHWLSASPCAPDARFRPKRLRCSERWWVFVEG